MSGRAKSSLPITIKVIDKELDAIRQEFAATQKQILQALKRASNRTMSKVKTEITRRLSQSEKIPQKVIRRRIFSRRAAVVGSAKKLKHAKLWLGLLRLPAHLLGRPTQNASGVRVGGRQFDGSYLAYFKSHKDSFGVYQRLSQISGAAEQIMRQRGHKVQKKTTVDYTATAFRIRAEINQLIPQWFLTGFRQELNFITNVKRAA
ncbi:MAG: phage tail protein [Lentisphaeraceae bacterium]|nr:phage tail protein [Lentisphaeraceae bacterium]